MKFVDEATITVIAGKGGDGCLSFRREKFIPRGGPDGGDGGDAGSVYLVVDDGLNTLADFRHARLFRADNGQQGMGQQRFGKNGSDTLIKVPMGTLVYDSDTDQLIGDMIKNHDKLLVAKGGEGGVGNTRFKSSTNRTPRRITQGESGEQRDLRLELQLLADVGLLGLPNAGKSSLIRQVTAAKPKVADYPFTTLYPHLGVVRLGEEQSFVIADIPGLIEGAADGVGLGSQFLKHLSRTRILLHLVDIGICDNLKQINDQIKIIDRELKRYSEKLDKMDRWLVLNKTDLLDKEKINKISGSLKKSAKWKHSYFMISAATGNGCKELMYAVQNRVTELKENQKKLDKTN